MFKSVIKFLFPSTKPKSQPNYYYFEESKHVKEDTKKRAVEDLQASLDARTIIVSSTEETYQKSFYDFLFGQSPPTSQHDELSLYVANEIESLLKQPKQFLQSLPVLPASLSSVINQINDKDFDAEELVKLIQQEPVIAAKVIELANSTYYNRSHKVITDLKAAFMLLGTNGLMEGVINGFVSKLTPQSKVYFQQYGNKIWQHSFSTGQIARTLIAESEFKQDAAQGYLIGLICNLGDMIIFQLLMEAFSFVHPDCQPNSYAFKELMFKNAKKITYHIAKHWNFPSPILDSLALQAKLTKSAMLKPIFPKRPIGCFIYEANIISEVQLRFEANDIGEDELAIVKSRLVYSEQAKNYLERMVSPTQSKS